MKSRIYTITSPSGAKYVGSAVNLGARLRAHFHGLGVKIRGAGGQSKYLEAA